MKFSSNTQQVVAPQLDRIYPRQYQKCIAGRSRPFGLQRNCPVVRLSRRSWSWNAAAFAYSRCRYEYLESFIPYAFEEHPPRFTIRQATDSYSPQLHHTAHRPPFELAVGLIAAIYNLAYAMLQHLYLTLRSSSPLVLLTSCIWSYLAGSFFFEVIHYLLHQCSRSRHRHLRRVGYLHQIHHLYFNRNLKFNNRYH